MVIRAAGRIQINILLERDENLDFADELTQDRYYPMLWIETVSPIYGTLNLVTG